MSASSWSHRSPPTKDTRCPDVGRWQPVTPADLTASRRQLCAALHNGARPAVATEDAVELLLLAFEELASNALRHGRAPIEVSVTTIGRSWLLEVSDAAVDRSPTPAVDRDPAFGGLGLPMVARICTDHGWTVDGERKVVWGRMDHACTGADAAPARTSGGTPSTGRRTDGQPAGGPRAGCRSAGGHRGRRCPGSDTAR